VPLQRPARYRPPIARDTAVITSDRAGGADTALWEVYGQLRADRRQTAKVLSLQVLAARKRLGAVERSLLVEYKDLRELFPGTADPFDGYGHPMAVVSEYGVAAGSVGVCGVPTLVRRGVGIDLLYGNCAEWRVADDRDLHAVAFWWCSSHGRARFQQACRPLFG
jgi:hypothetical protein